jgi:hypothetical protein
MHKSSAKVKARQQSPHIIVIVIVIHVAMRLRLSVLVISVHTPPILLVLVRIPVLRVVLGRSRLWPAMSMRKIFILVIVVIDLGIIHIVDSFGVSILFGGLRIL